MSINISPQIQIQIPPRPPHQHLSPPSDPPKVFAHARVSIFEQAAPLPHDLILTTCILPLVGTKRQDRFFGSTHSQGSERIGTENQPGNINPKTARS